MNHRFDLRNPPFAFRVVLVASVLAVPGALAGEMVGLIRGHFASWTVAGALVGTMVGALMEGVR